jgi:hypothetical protein
VVTGQITLIQPVRNQGTGDMPCDRPVQERRLPRVPDAGVRPSPSVDPQLEAARVVGYLPGLGSCIDREE